MRFEQGSGKEGYVVLPLDAARAGDQLLLTAEVKDALGLNVRFDTVITVPPLGP